MALAIAERKVPVNGQDRIRPRSEGSSPVASDMQERAASINAGEMGHVDRSFARMRACMRRSCG